MSPEPSVFERLSSWLAEHQVSFEVLEHDSVYTSEEAARVRGTSLSSGAKALICKTDQQFVMFVIPADRRLAAAVQGELAWVNVWPAA